MTHWTEQDVAELAKVLEDRFGDRALDCWPTFEPEAQAVLEHLDAAGRLIPRPRENDDPPQPRP